MSFKKQHKTRKHKTRKHKTRKTLKRGGYMYTNANAERDRHNEIYKYKYGSEETGEYSVKYDSNWIPPKSFIDSLTNVSIVPNNNDNYRYFGMLIMVVKYPNDISTIKWTLDKYLEKYVLPVLLENNENGVNYTLDHIKINDFKINYNSTSIGIDNNYRFKMTTLPGEFFITGSIYVYDSKRLNMSINKKLDNKLPNDIIKEVNQFIK